MNLKFITLLLLLCQSALSAVPQITISEKQDEVVMELNLEYTSPYKKIDIDALLDPKNDHIQDLFRDRISLSETPKVNQYGVRTSVALAVIRLSFICKLDYTVTTSTDASVHQFYFFDFDHLFAKSIIRVVVNSTGDRTKISISQTARLRKADYANIKSVPFGEKTFKSKISANLRQFMKATGGT